jgi:hypothetical protein
VSTGHISQCLALQQFIDGQAAWFTLHPLFQIDTNSNGAVSHVFSNDPSVGMISTGGARPLPAAGSLFAFVSVVNQGRLHLNEGHIDMGAVRFAGVLVGIIVWSILGRWFCPRGGIP